jgi:hypothetical protein
MRQLVTWEGGSPVVKNVPIISAAQVRDLHSAVLARPYSEPGDELRIEMGLKPSRFFGLTLLEVMLIRRAERAAATGECEDVLDRELGKPKTTSENYDVKETYEQRLLRIAAAENAKRAARARPAQDVKIHDAEVVEPETQEEPWTLL